TGDRPADVACHTLDLRIIEAVDGDLVVGAEEMKARADGARGPALGPGPYPDDEHEHDEHEQGDDVRGDSFHGRYCRRKDLWAPFDAVGRRSLRSGVGRRSGRLAYAAFAGGT